MSHVMLWYSMLWYKVTCCDVIWYGMQRDNIMIWYNMIWYMMRDNVVIWYDMLSYVMTDELMSFDVPWYVIIFHVMI